MCVVGVWANTSREMAVTIGRIMMARTKPMKKIVPPVMPVGSKIGSQLSLDESQSSIGRTMGRKTMRPHKP